MDAQHNLSFHPLSAGEMRASGKHSLVKHNLGELEDGIGKISGIAFGWSRAECLIFSVTKQFVPCWVAHCQGNKYKFLKGNKIKRKNKHSAMTCSAN